MITGVVCDRNGKLKVPNKLREEIIEGFNDIKNLKNEELQQKKSSLLGEIYSAGQIKPYIFSAMIRRIK
ncbi:hypothetical protein [Clostridium hydrogeniformans]|uniref:hypothetical protein n=1 Tax=Clostridium hydrogeniformans TaxID=349933 RepID=UPI00048350B9|nr:hypothetical protein [Clostridium hydrogeniformans]